MISWIKSNLRLIVGAAWIAASVIAFVSIKGCIDEKNDRIAELTTKLVTSEQTVEVERGLFAKKAAEVTDLKDLLAKMGEENTKLAELVRRGEMEVLTLNQLVIRWKKAYEGAVAANQTEEPPVVPGDPPRTRVEFTGVLGPFSVSGHTLSNPPEAWLHLSQFRPLRLTVAVTKNRDGTFSSLVTSDDDNIQTEIAVSAVDASVLRPRWRQRIWVEGRVNVLGDRSASVGLSYRMDRWSLGVSCLYGEATSGCGVTAGYRLFK